MPKIPEPNVAEPNVAEPAVPAAGFAPEPLRATAPSPAEVAGVMRLFVALLVLSIGGALVEKLGAPAAKVDVGMTGVFALVAVLCAISARAEIAPLLARTGGWRGGVAALAGFGILVCFGRLYFPTVRWLGFSFLRMTDPYLEAGWPRWTAYLLVALAPALFEELTFRGYVMARLDRLLTARETLLVQAALFSVLHLGIVIFPSHFVIGLVLGTVRRRTGSLYPGMAVHLGWNGAIVWAELSGRHFL